MPNVALYIDSSDLGAIAAPLLMIGGSYATIATGGLLAYLKHKQRHQSHPQHETPHQVLGYHHGDPHYATNDVHGHGDNGYLNGDYSDESFEHNAIVSHHLEHQLHHEESHPIPYAALHHHSDGSHGHHVQNHYNYDHHGYSDYY